MMRQYLALKDQVPDALLFYRMGDFYELFFDDARNAAEILELTLTSRNKSDPDPIPMAGIPHHALEGYLRRLTEAGKTVAIAEQQAAPPGSGSKIMERALVRVVTPGVPWSPDDLDARQSCWLASVHLEDGKVGLAFLDLSTGELRIGEAESEAQAGQELRRLEPREVLLHSSIGEGSPVREGLEHSAITSADADWFDARAARTQLCDLLGTRDLVGHGAQDLTSPIQAAGALLTYVRDTARVTIRNVCRLTVMQLGGHMSMDGATRRNLEILRPLRGTGRRGTLLHHMDRTCTAMGGRLLREWLSAPLTACEAIQHRHDALEALLDGRIRRQVRDRLRLVADLERLAGKAAQGTANARDLVALAGSLRALPGMADLLAPLPALCARMPEDLVDDVTKDIEHWLVDEPPAAMADGGLIRQGVHAELDEVTQLAREGKGAIARIEAREREQTGINSLKVKHNKVFGYFLEVTSANIERVPDCWIRKQTLVNCERYITPELKEFEEKVLGADERRRAMELELFRELRLRVGAQVGRIQVLAQAVAWIDVIAGFSELAIDRRHVRPTVGMDLSLRIEGGRHPVVEAMASDERFVPNDIELGPEGRLVILTGPNMAGKSTIMRQVALIALMAQVGAFVPADAAHIGICDRIFVRVGASDDLAHGRSTFMVEMSETALILNQATERSLILLDEIGRGTSTYDGMAIAWAVAEAVHDSLKARAIFATHYHELAALKDHHPSTRNMQVAVSEWGERIIFLRTLKEGSASKSYGIQCARLAGMPADVVARAQTLLQDLEQRRQYMMPTPQLALFGRASADPEPAAEEHPALDALDSLDPDSMSPREALDALYRLKDLCP